MQSVYFDQYLNMITSEHRLRPKYMAFVESVLKPLWDVFALLDNFNYEYMLEFAEGAQLDVIGAIVGADRNVKFLLSDGTTRLSDALYRIVIKAKIIRNHWDGSLKSLYEVWHRIMGDELPLDFIDYQNMSCDISVGTDIVSEDMFLLIHNDLILPRPVGVQYTYDYGIKPIFAFDDDQSYLRGWDIGYWTEDIDYGDLSIFSWDSDVSQYRGWDIGYWTLSYAIGSGSQGDNAGE